MLHARACTTLCDLQIYVKILSKIMNIIIIVKEHTKMSDRLLYIKLFKSYKFNITREATGTRKVQRFMEIT